MGEMERARKQRSDRRRDDHRWAGQQLDEPLSRSYARHSRLARRARMAAGDDPLALLRAPARGRAAGMDRFAARQAFGGGRRRRDLVGAHRHGVRLQRKWPPAE